jgi:two-component system chemotaxis response regulator CheB
MVTLSKNQGRNAQANLESDTSEPSEISPLRVLVVDDSKLIRRVLRDIIESDYGKKVVGEAEDGKVALDLLMRTDPDVITLDVNMPVMDGLTALKHIMIKRPTPTVMISAFTQEGALETFDSLKYGAIDFLPKPTQVKGADLNSQKDQIIQKIELAAAVQIESVRYLRRFMQKKKLQVDRDENSQPFDFLLTLGASEGGYGSLLSVIPGLQKHLPATYIAVLHQAPQHVDAFARYLNQCSQVEVIRATDGIPLKAGVCYLATTSEYAVCEKRQEKICLRLKADDKSRSCDAIDMLMLSASDAMEHNAAGVILSGTGKDGVKGMGGIIMKGGTSFVQSPANCLFKETPLAVTDEYSIDYIIGEKQMAGAINAFLLSHSV